MGMAWYVHCGAKERGIVVTAPGELLRLSY